MPAAHTLLVNSRNCGAVARFASRSVCGRAADTHAGILHRETRACLRYTPYVHSSSAANIHVPLSQKLYRRWHVLTVKLAHPQSRLLVAHIDLLRAAYAVTQKRYPFRTVAICVMPNHLHAVWTLPPDDADYSLRWRLIKTRFSAHFPSAALSVSKQRRHERGIWQRRFYEHTVHDAADLQRCVDYVHFNPVKHGFVARVQEWPYSSFHRYAQAGWLPWDWGGTREVMTAHWGE